MQLSFFEVVKARFSPERLDAYAKSVAGAPPDPCSTLGRYLLNMALCESLYSPLQLCEIALRNSIHQHLAQLFGRDDWYDEPQFQLTAWAQVEVGKAKVKITKAGKTVIPGRVIAELQFGFWTSMFEAHYEQHTPFLPGGIKKVFPHLHKRLHNRKKIKSSLETIRQLRNRVFHHERIIHWVDLGAQHDLILDVIAWISPELHHMAIALDRFKDIRAGGLVPWMAKIRQHWPAAKVEEAENGK